MKRLAGAITGLVFVLATFVSTTKPAYSFTKGKTIRILSGYSPGGGHDTEGRLITRWIGKYLPGKPKSVIKMYMPGAAGMIQGAYIYNRASRDGLTWAIVGTSHMGNQALASPRPNFDLLKMPQIFATSGSSAAIVRDFLGVRKGVDLLKIDPSKIAVSGRSIVGPSFLNDVLGLQLLGIKGYKYAVGYPGTAQMALAFFSGEVSYVGGTGLHHVLGQGGRYYSAIKEGKAFVIWQGGVLTPEGKVIRSPGTNIPTFAEVYKEIHGRPPSGPAWEAYKLTGPTLRTLNRSLVVPPGVPPERVAILREALRKLYSDPAYIKEWERLFGLKLDFISGQDADKILRKLLQPSPGWDYLKNEFIPKLQAKK
ncbi:MAG: Bug family tripartite tricarboxylate transporter substrate binding protein [Candidatus Binatia bacterium]